MQTEKNKSQTEESSIPAPTPTQQDKAPTVYDRMAVQLSNNYDSAAIAVIHNTIAKGTTPTELMYFLNLAKGVALNPFTREIWCYKDHKNNLVVFAGRDGFLAIAQRDAKYGGIRSGTVCEHDVFVNEQGTGQPNVMHSVALGDRGKIIGAWCIVFVEGKQNYFEWVDFDDYNRSFGAWQTHPKDMIKKVAEVHALKKAFGIHGLHAEDDFIISEAEGVAMPLQNKAPLNK